MNSLPTEILAQILKHHISGSPPIGTYEPSTPSDPLTTMEVCRKWRSIALDFPDCWSSIKIKIDLERPIDVEYAKNLVLTGIAHLHRRFELVKHQPVELNVDLNLYPSRDRIILVKFARLLRYRLHRLRMYREIGTSGLLFELIPYLPEKCYSDLVYLEFANSNMARDVVFPEADPPKHILCPLLKQLSLTIPNTSRRFQDTLAQFTCPELQTLRITKAGTAFDQPIPFFNDYLTRYPSLRTLILDIHIFVRVRATFPGRMYSPPVLYIYSSPKVPPPKRSISLYPYIGAIHNISTLVLSIVTIMIHVNLDGALAVSKLRILRSSLSWSGNGQDEAHCLRQSITTFLSYLNQLRCLHIGYGDDEDDPDWPSFNSDGLSIDLIDLHTILGVLIEQEPKCCLELEHLIITNVDLKPATLALLIKFLRGRTLANQVITDGPVNIPPSRCLLSLRNCNLRFTGDEMAKRFPDVKEIGSDEFRELLLVCDRNCKNGRLQQE